ncbi:MAG: polysaccharide deacetylase family protein [Planctomycetota bacterium]|jgi:peptidoglycan/xylan/chitin deacetylase (PgdA/CDA1 family)|nr:polysaccharide deacetylase family protein [Planctomycetota bacterium]
MGLFRSIKKRWRRLTAPPVGVIYMLHRCSPLNRDNLRWNEHLKVSPEFLANFIREQRRTRDFISLDDVAEIAAAGKRPPRPFIVMTFDDGYRDNYEYALPIFTEARAPFAVYVANGFPRRAAFLWWYVLEDILLKNAQITLSDGSAFTCSTKAEKEDLFLQLRARILSSAQENLSADFRALFANYEFDAAEYAEKLCANWDEVVALSRSPYCTIGAHTLNHYALNRLTADALENEIIGSKNELEQKLGGGTIRHFAYPYGTPNEVSSREIDFVVQRTDFTTACYADGGEVKARHLRRPRELPRVFLGEL